MGNALSARFSIISRNIYIKKVLFRFLATVLGFLSGMILLLGALVFVKGASNLSNVDSTIEQFIVVLTVPYTILLLISRKINFLRGLILNAIILTILQLFLPKVDNGYFLIFVFIASFFLPDSFFFQSGAENRSLKLYSNQPVKLIFTIFFMIIFYPLGLLLMWEWINWTGLTKFFVTVAILFFVPLFIGLPVLSVILKFIQ